MNPTRSKLVSRLYPVFLISCGLATALALMLIWGDRPDKLQVRLLFTCCVIAVASAITMSASRIVAGPPPEDDVG